MCTWKYDVFLATKIPLKTCDKRQTLEPSYRKLLYRVPDESVGKKPSLRRVMSILRHVMKVQNRVTDGVGK